MVGPSVRNDLAAKSGIDGQQHNITRARSRAVRLAGSRLFKVDIICTRHEAEVVYVNDRRAGSLWCPPYALEVSSLLRPGDNRIRIVVANLALNYMAGRRLPDYRLLNLRYGERFQAQDMDKVQPIPSGLLGPIRLIASADSNQ